VSSKLFKIHESLGNQGRHLQGTPAVSRPGSGGGGKYGGGKVTPPLGDSAPAGCTNWVEYTGQCT